MNDPNSHAPRLLTLGQRRNLTVLFSDLSDSTRLADGMETEHYAAMLTELRALYQSVVPRHGGTVVRIQGDGMLAIFGYPELREDDGRRATEAALELHERVSALQPPSGAAQWPHGHALNLHSGIHAGLVLIEDGDAVRGRFELLGNTPNFAARLSDEAEADEILVSEETLGLQSHYFRTSARREVHIKGRNTPLTVYSILGRVAIGRRFEASRLRGLSPFIGRVRELAVLESALDQLLQGQAHWFSVRASAGLGKTRLTEEFLRRAAERNCQVHRGYCESYLSAEPLQPFLQMTRLLQAQGLSQAGELLATPATARPDAWLQLLEGLARQAPQLVCVDDLQWADDASLTLLHRLHHLALEQRLPILLLTATRPPPVADVLAASALPSVADGLSVLDLQPFNEAEAAAAVVHLLPATDPFVASEIQRHAGGNPLYIEELCHAIKHEALKQAASATLGREQVGQAWLAALIESRVARLPQTQTHLLRAAAVIGNVIPSWLLQRVTGCGERDPAMLALAEEDFLFPDRRAGFLRFKHGITRDVVYESIGWHERQSMHLQVAAELRAQPVNTPRQATDEMLAYHGAAAGLWAEAAFHAERAGDQALASSALDRAKKQYRAALVALEHLPPDPSIDERWVAIAQRFGQACVFDASRADLRVMQHAAKLAASSADTARFARAEYWLAYVSYALGEAKFAMQHCQQGLFAAQQAGDENLALQLRGTLGQVLAAMGDYPAALSLLDQALASQRPRGSASGLASTSGMRRPAIGRSYSLACKAYVLGDQGQFEAAHQVFDEALSHVRGSNLPVEASVQGWRAVVFLWQGRWTEARDCALESKRIGARVRSLFTFAMGHAAAAYAAWVTSRSSSAAADLRDALAWLDPRGGRLFCSLIHGWLAEVLAEQGDRPAARHQIALALHCGRQSDWIGVAMAYRVAARLAQADGRPAAVSRYLAAAERVAALRGSAHETANNQLYTAELAAQQGQPAQRALAQAARTFEAMGMAWHLSRAQQALSKY
ncbi:adenylate/guanylate cyclase domain-containing protein [Roseateles sp.]|uniref:adenylate/guanylate cyclase domain-containing protein n=1 Tax=Roseateles sp. TaxID=1971397 RepID=UPI003BA6B700